MINADSLSQFFLSLLIILSITIIIFSFPSITQNTQETNIMTDETFNNTNIGISNMKEMHRFECMQLGGRYVQDKYCIY